MATSEVQVCSNALLLLGANPINSFDDESDRALLVSNLWDNCRDAVLRSHPWNCAVKRVALSPDGATPAFDYAYQFTLPGDCLRVMSVGEEGEAFRFRLEGRKILMDDAVCKLGYIYKNEDVTTWDALLVEAMEAYMAMTCAYPITKSASMQKSMADLYQYKLKQARSTDAQEQPSEDVGDYPLLSVRR
jgi:hypothetical protein